MCSERLVEVLSSLRRHGLLGKCAVVAVGSGWPSAAAALVDELRLDARACGLRVLADPQREAYRHLRAHRGVLRTFTWTRWANVLGFLAFPAELCCRRRVPGLNAGDPWQQGGTFVLAARGQRELYALREEAPGWPALDEAALVSAVRTAIAQGAR